MFDAPTASHWSSDPHFLESTRHWTWHRSAMPPVLEQASTGTAETDLQALADAFWAWVELLDQNQRFETLDPLDFAHYACGLYLYFCLDTRPLKLGASLRADEVGALTTAALTLLVAWRQALGAPPLAPRTHETDPAWWASYVENLAEDHSQAIPFLDWISGLESDGRIPLSISERPAMQAALEARQRTS